jgi:hypothetical protein
VFFFWRTAENRVSLDAGVEGGLDIPWTGVRYRYDQLDILVSDHVGEY